ncbi:MAG: 4'-phosphopantetheinyl transferase family protein [Thermochromatium sp.]
MSHQNADRPIRTARVQSPGGPPIAWRPDSVRLHPEARLTLEPDSLHLWRIETGENGLDPDDGWAQLSEVQRVRVEALRHDRQRERYLRALAGLNRVLATYLGRSPAQIRIARHSTGKPYLAGTDCWLSFSFSHSGDLALVAVSAGEEAAVGVDCEQIRPRVNTLAIARRLFDPETVAELEALSESRRLERFYRAWTALEADVKCDGRGLLRPRPPTAVAPQIAHVIPAPGYIAAVARARLPPVETWRMLEFRD